MRWIDESRRIAFGYAEQARAKERAASSGCNEIRGDLDLALPEEVRLCAVAIGNELIFGYDDALAAIGIATDMEIAVLGFDAGEVLEDGFQVLDYTGYDGNVPFTGSWKAYVGAMNVEAERWIQRASPRQKSWLHLDFHVAKRVDECQRWAIKQGFKSAATRLRS